MIHTSIEVPEIPVEYTALTDLWRSKGFVVLQKVVVGHGGEETAVKPLLENIAEVYPDHEPLETVAACQGIRFFVAAKCKVKENEAYEI